MTNQDLITAHLKLSDDIRDIPWVSNCAGEVFLLDGDEKGIRIGHFQGDAILAEFIVKAHNMMLPGQSATTQLNSE